MTDFEETRERFETDLGHFLLDIQTIRKVDRVAFQKIDRDAEGLARALKGQALVPKALLNDFRIAIKILHAEAPYIPGEQSELIRMANKLEMTFDLILIGESPEDRIPGVPRII
jgi:hypothetical protein